MKNRLLDMINVLEQYKHNKEDIMFTYVSERLEKSFNEYDKELKQSVQYLTLKHEKSLIKRMKKIDDKSC